MNCFIKNVLFSAFFSCFILNACSKKDITVYPVNCPTHNDEAKKEKDNYIAMFDAKETLTVCSMYKMTSEYPEFFNILHEGNVAYYGLIAQAEKNIALAKKVSQASTDDYEWEYSYEYGGTAADSAIVLEALIDLKIENEKIQNAFATFIKKYYDSKNGCFTTLSGDTGRAEYWKGCSTETTAHIAFLMYEFDQSKYKEYIQNSADYMSTTINNEGFWKSRWFPSDTIATFYSVRLLNVFGNKYEHEINRSIKYIKNSQEKNGSWKNSVIETSAALLALKTIQKNSPEIENSSSWLKNSDSLNNPEPLLYYWFESESSKMFFNCYDKGAISKAWKKIALQK